jgi:hypothetical protein
MNKTKTCIKCGVSYPETTEYYHKDKCHRNGLSNKCKKCRGEIRKKYYKNKKDKEKEKNLEYRKINYRKVKIKKREYRQDNEIMIQGKTYYYRTCNNNVKSIIEGLIAIRQKHKLLKEVSDG